MAIIKWNPNGMIDDFFNDDDFFMPMRRMHKLMPAVDVYENKDNVFVEASLSGIDPEKVNITVEDDVLRIEGKEEHTSEVDEKNYYRKEIRHGSFTRAIPLPMKVKSDATNAEYKDGILKITLPKADEVKPKSIKVNVKK
jgi:HSP20 family protein